MLRNAFSRLFIHWKDSGHRGSAETVELDPFLEVLPRSSTRHTSKEASSYEAVADEEAASQSKSSQSAPWTRLSQKFTGWKGGVVLNALIIGAIFIINTIILIWALSRREDDDVIYHGNCELTSRWTMIAHGAINIFGSVALSASNYAMQVLVAPTREEVDKAHQQKRWVRIGTQTLTNFGFISAKRLLLWVLLAMSSVPFHLM